MRRAIPHLLIVLGILGPFSIEKGMIMSPACNTPQGNSTIESWCLILKNQKEKYPSQKDTLGAMPMHLQQSLGVGQELNIVRKHVRDCDAMASDKLPFYMRRCKSLRDEINKSNQSLLQRLLSDT